MNLDQSKPTHRMLVAFAITGFVTLAVWGAWMSLGAVFGSLGWVLAKLGGVLLRATDGIIAVHGTVALVGFGCGAVVGVVVGFNVRADRLWERLSQRRRPGGGATEQSEA